MTRKSIRKGLRFEILNRDNFTCRYCGAKAPDVSLELDHVVPVSKGGKNNKENLVTSCWGCNIGKGAKELKSVYPERHAINSLTTICLDMSLKKNIKISRKLVRWVLADMSLLWNKPYSEIINLFERANTFEDLFIIYRDYATEYLFSDDEE